MIKKSKHIVFIIIGLFLLNFAASKYYKRYDLTEDNRYSLTESTKESLSKITNPLIVNVYLQGDFPAEFKRLQIETKQILEELKALNKNVQFRFINPANKEKELIDKGLDPSQLQTMENGKVSEMIIFPWATMRYKNKIEIISLLKESNAISQNEQLENAIQHLEYAFANAIHKVSTEKFKKIAVLKGNGELNDAYLVSFLKTLSDYYLLAPFTLDSVSTNPQKTINQLKEFDLAIIAKPTEKFSEEEKFTIDQFIMSGGKSLWLIDNVQAELDSLMQTGETLAYPRNLGLTDMFFAYEFRINLNLLEDLYNAPIALATGNLGGKTQFNTFPWRFYPVINPIENNLINTNLDAINLKFSSTIDTLKGSIKKTILLQSSPLSKTLGTPAIISLKSIADKPIETDYTKGNKTVGLLLEGNFKSTYAGRVKPIEIKNTLEESKLNKLIVIADGDIAANEVLHGEPQELGLNVWTNQIYGNKDFLLNSVNYLLDDIGLLKTRSKKITINFLDKQKAYEQAFKWQLINVVLPLVLLIFFGIVFSFFRSKLYKG
jgi:gliding-associated putative ABC transporter substrate-binding component GldG